MLECLRLDYVDLESEEACRAVAAALNFSLWSSTIASLVTEWRHWGNSSGEEVARKDFVSAEPVMKMIGTHLTHRKGYLELGPRGFRRP
jgi:hypothetical protein